MNDIPRLASQLQANYDHVDTLSRRGVSDATMDDACAQAHEIEDGLVAAIGCRVGGFICIDVKAIAGSEAADNAPRRFAIVPVDAII